MHKAKYLTQRYAKTTKFALGTFVLGQLWYMDKYLCFFDCKRFGEKCRYYECGLFDYKRRAIAEAKMAYNSSKLYQSAAQGVPIVTKRYVHLNSLGSILKTKGIVGCELFTEYEILTDFLIDCEEVCHLFRWCGTFNWPPSIKFSPFDVMVQGQITRRWLITI